MMSRYGGTIDKPTQGAQGTAIEPTTYEVWFFASSLKELESPPMPSRCCLRINYRFALLPTFALITTIPLMVMSGCGMSQENAPPQPAATDNDVVATVNGVTITRGAMYSEMEQYVPAQVQDFPRNQTLTYPTGRVALQHLITNELMVQLARLNQVPVTQQDITDRYNDVKMVREAQSTNTFEDTLADEGLTPQQFDYGTISPDVAQYNLLSKGVSVTESELQSYYNSHINEYTIPTRVHIERIVLSTQAAAEQAYQLAVSAHSLDPVMQQNIAVPLAGGADNADIAQWINIDTPPPLLSPLASLAANAEPGAILKPFRVQNQWWVARVVDLKTRSALPYFLVSHIVKWNVETTKAEELGNVQRVQQEMQEMTQQAIITVKQVQYLSLVKQLKNPAAPTPIAEAPSASGS
jgi:hypothetical protein